MSAEQHADTFVRRHTPLFSLLALGTSVLLHGVAYASLSLAPVPALAVASMSEVTFEMAPPPPPREAVPPPESTAARAEPAARAAAPAPARTAPAPRARALDEAPAPLALGGVTLTNDAGEAGWSSVAGSGSAMLRPPSTLRGQPAVAAARAVATRRAESPAWVAAADLSERPRPPALDGVLRQNYPEDARARGISGTARVRAQIGPDGRARRIRVLSESFSGFGDACRRTVLGSRWSPPLDRTGDPVATEIAYTCRFVVEH